MLKHLHIENFALVSNLDIDFGTGMNVLTGETGAGKSIIVGAIARLLGEKADQTDVRTGSGLAVIEGEFDIDGNPEIIKTLDLAGIEHDKKSMSMRREIILNKPSKSFINGQLITLTQLRDITHNMAELFGQHSHQQLLDEKNHQSFLDNFAGIGDRVEQLRQIFHDWQNNAQQLNRLEKSKESEKKERELLLFQKEEIQKAAINIGEEEELLAERKILDSARLLGEKASLILNLVDQDENAALNLLGSCRKELSDMAAIDKKLEQDTELMESAIINLEELRSRIEAYLSSIPDDPDRLEQINLRLDEIYRLKKKYGGSEEAILETFNQINVQLGRMIDVEEQLKILRADEKKLRLKYIEMASAISADRKKGSQKLSRVIEKELNQVGINSAKFDYEFIYEPDGSGIEFEGNKIRPNPDGFETGRFLVSANPGEPLKPLARTASGGEISRIMLALKAADKRLSGKYRMLLVFDEIDAGIGGRTAGMVASRLAQLAVSSQVLVITHLHQIASLSDAHYAVEKVESSDRSKRNVVAVRRLTMAERKGEIERMLSLPENPNV
ncbi:MAG: DNA repair protein RecN [Candidatus Zixiibacteriota bacterium]